MRYKVHTPQPGYTGDVAGVHFVDGTATVDSTSPAYQFFRRHGYELVPSDTASSSSGQQGRTYEAPGSGTGPFDPSGLIEHAQGTAGASDEDAIPAPSRPAKNASKDDWVTYATSVLGLTTDEADAKSKAELAQLADEHEEKNQ